MRIAVAGATGMVGRYVAQSAHDAGHSVVGLSRSRGIDVRSGEGLERALDGVEVLVDVTNAPTTEEAAATAFFTEAARTLQRIGAGRGIRHIVALSIVGIDRMPFGYYAAKLAQERAVAAGPIPSTVLRATPFHEFPAQLISRTRNGSEARVFDVRVRTVAARTVARVLIELAEGTHRGRAQDLAGPQEADLIALARRFAKCRRLPINVQPDAEAAVRLPPDAFIPGDDVRIEGPTYEEWLASEDAAELPF